MSRAAGSRTGRANPSREMTILEHLQELRLRVIVSLVALVCAATACYVLYETIVAFLYEPFRQLEPLAGRRELLYVNTLLEGFLTRIKVAVLAGLVFSLPVHLYNIVKFVLPGLAGRERRILFVSLAVSFAMVLVSFYYGYFRIIPISLRFLSGAGFIPPRVGILLNYGRNIFFILQFLLITLLVFQLPILLEILMIMKVLRRQTLLRSARYVVIGIFVLAAVLTPPDFVSQLSLGLPLVALFFLTILVARVFNFGGD